MKDKYTCTAQNYSKLGNLLTTTLEADDIEELQRLKDNFIYQHKGQSEVITFGNVLVTKVEVWVDTYETKYFVEKTTNPYLMSLAK